MTDDDNIKAAFQQSIFDYLKTRGATAPRDIYGNSIILLTNPENELFRFEMTLRNMIIDSEGGYKNIGEPLCNDEGINMALGTVQAVTNQVTVMSNIDEKAVKIFTMYVADNLIKMCIRKRRFGIRDEESANLMVLHGVSYVYMTCRRAFEEGEKRFLRGSTQEVRSTVINDSPKKGVMGRLGEVVGFGR